MKMLSQQVETEDRPRAVPREEVPRKRSDHARTAQRERVVGREGVRLVGEEDDVGPQREDLLDGHRRIALALAQHVAAADALDQRGDVRVAAAPHPRRLPDRHGEGEGRRREARLVERAQQHAGVAMVDRAEGGDQRGHVVDALRLRHQNRREGLDLLGVPAQVLLEVHVNEVRPQRPDLRHARVLRPAGARQRQLRREDAEVGDADDRVARAEVEERLGQGWDQRDDAARRRVEAVLAAERVAHLHGARYSTCMKKTERLSVWLTPEQIAWLKTKKNASETVRAAVTEAMKLDRLKESVKRKKK